MSISNNDNLTLFLMFQDLLVHNVSKIEEYKIVLPNEMRKYLLVIMKHNKEIFDDIENSVKKILADERIDSNDIPELLLVIAKLYEIVYKSKHIKNKKDYYDIVKTCIHLSFVLYLKYNNISNDDIVSSMSKIIDSSIELIKLKTSIKTPSKLANFKLFS